MGLWIEGDLDQARLRVVHLLSNRHFREPTEVHITEEVEIRSNIDHQQEVNKEDNHQEDKLIQKMKMIEGCSVHLMWIERLLDSLYQKVQSRIQLRGTLEIVRKN